MQTFLVYQWTSFGSFILYNLFRRFKTEVLYKTFKTDQKGSLLNNKWFCIMFVEPFWFFEEPVKVSLEYNHFLNHLIH